MIQVLLALERPQPGEGVVEETAEPVTVRRAGHGAGPRVADACVCDELALY